MLKGRQVLLSYRRLRCDAYLPYIDVFVVAFLAETAHIIQEIRANHHVCEFFRFLFVEMKLECGTIVVKLLAQRSLIFCLQP